YHNIINGIGNFGIDLLVDKTKEGDCKNDPANCDLSFREEWRGSTEDIY
ncbi:MAG: hypothetical protein JO080_05565, partial [Mucilaginibacter sp.]|nr:hypothetical protein [Mucilaginibacter sp.]